MVIKNFWTISSSNWHLVSFASMTRSPPETLLVLAETHSTAVLEHPAMCIFKIHLSIMLIVSWSGHITHSFSGSNHADYMYLVLEEEKRKENKTKHSDLPPRLFYLFFLQLSFPESGRQVLTSIPTQWKSQLPELSCRYAVLKQDHGRKGFTENTWIALYYYPFHS